MEEDSYNVLNAFRGNDLVEMDLTIPAEKENEVKRMLDTKYEMFQNGCWQAEDPQTNKITLWSPTITVEKAKKICQDCPGYVGIKVSAVYPVGSEEAVYEGPLTVAKKEFRSIQRKFRKLIGKT
jgi:hypothetical protein